MAAGNQTTSSLGDSLHVRIISGELDFQTLIVFSPDDTAWQAKQKIISSVCPDRKDVLNFGLYCPSVNNRAGKFLDEERPLRDYPMPGPIGLLEFKYKKRIYKTQYNPTKLKKLHTSSGLKKFLDYVYKCDADKVTELTNKGLDPNFLDNDKGETPMTVAANLPRPRSVMLALISGGAYLDFRNRKGLTALHVAAEAGNRDSIKTLLDLGASPNYKDAQGLTPLYYCVARGNGMAQCIQMLLHDRAEICNRDENNWTEIHHACMHGKVQHLEHLLFYGAEMNAKTTSGDTALHVCARYNEEECARALLFRGADKTLKNTSGEDAVTMARLAGHTKLADVILNFSSEDIVLYTELPKYNEKRRGTISMATIRNLQRSRSNPQLHKLFSQDGNYAASLSSAGGYQVLNNGFLFDGAKHQVEPGQGHATPEDSFPHSSAQHQPESEPPRTLILHRDPTGFGFILRGAKSRSGTGTERLKFKPTPYCPALQYFDNVEKGSVAERSGLLSGDYLLEINGENVISASHDYTVSLIKNSGNQVTLKVVTAERRPKGNGEPAQSTSESMMTARIIPASLSPSVGSQMKSSLAGLEELERLDASLDKYENETVAQTQHINPAAVPIYSSAYHREHHRKDSHRNQSPPISDHRTSIYVNQSPIRDNGSTNNKGSVNRNGSMNNNGQINNNGPINNNGQINNNGSLARNRSFERSRSMDYVNDPSRYANNGSISVHSTGTGMHQRPRSSVIGQAEPEPDYDDASAWARSDSSRSGGGSQDTEEEDLASSSFAVMIKQATLNRERRIKDRRESVENIVFNPTVAPLANHNPPNHNATSVPPAPPPPPPPPIASAALPEMSHRRTGSDSGRPVPPQVKKHLDENRKRDEAHAALMAAVLKRRSMLETSSDDTPQVADSIETKLQKSRKIQVIYRGDHSKQELTTTPTRPNSLYPSSDANNGSLGRSTSTVNNNNGSTMGNHGVTINGVVINATTTDSIKGPAPKKIVPAPASKPNGSVGVFGDLARKGQLGNEREDVPTIESSRAMPKRAPWTSNNSQAFPPSPPINHSAGAFPPPPFPGVGGYPTRYADRFANEDAASTISTLSTLSTLSSLSPENPSSAGSSPPQHQPSYMSKANVTARNNHQRLDLSQIPEGVVGVMIPPPAEFLGDDEETGDADPAPSDPHQQYNALPVAATLRTINKAPFGNSMVFPARVKDVKSSQNGCGPGSSFADKPLDTWTVPDVCEWLDSLDYGTYKERFTERNITGKRLTQLGENDMQSLGVEKVLHRIKLVREVRKLLKGPGLRLA